MPATVTNFRYPTRGVCCAGIIVSLKNGAVEDIEIFGGCDGNHRGLSRLVRGRPATEVISLLKGTPCGDKGTSCPDQLALALEAALQ